MRNVLLYQCPDRSGLIVEISSLILQNNGNIVSYDQFIVKNTFLARVEWEGVPVDFDFLAKKHIATYAKSKPQKMAIFVSRQDHCILDLLQRHKRNELIADIPLIISNHQEIKEIADYYSIEYVHLPITKKNKLEQEIKQLEILEKHNITLLVLAKYMQIFSGNFVSRAPPIINIHHSFLPAFPGSQPYQQAYDRGVKVIGATAHFATANLDSGPIIAQEVIKISHRDTVRDLIRKGKDAERIALARAVRLQLESRIIIHADKTIVFD